MARQLNGEKVLWVVDRLPAAVTFSKLIMLIMDLSVMNISSLDLNLLKVFDAVMRHGSVSAAASELGLSQPAVSNALSRLRGDMGDELFVRTRQRMEPTAYAQAIRGPVAEGLATIRAGLRQGAAFNPLSSERRFRLLFTDAGEVEILSRLIELLRSRAPSVELLVDHLPIERYFEALESDAVDIAIGTLEPRERSLVVKPLFVETYTILCRQDHPWIRHPPDREAYQAAKHVVVIPPNSRTSAFRELALQRHLKMRAILTVPHYFVLAPIIERSDLVVTVPTRVANELCRNPLLGTVQLPVPSPTIRINMVWHIRQKKDIGRQWLQKLISESVTSS